MSTHASQGPGYNAGPNPAAGQIDRKPEGVAHKPLYLLPYALRDGKYTSYPTGTDAQYLDIGFSQWDPNDLSAKVWRHTAGKWSRQSEEIPIHRVFDLAQFALQVLVHRDPFGAVTIPANVFEAQSDEITLNEESIKFPPSVRIRNVFNYLGHNPDEVERLNNRLKTLRDQLNAAYNPAKDGFDLY